MPKQTPFKVGDWLVEPDLGRLSRGDEQLGLRRQVMELLVYLAERPGDVVSTDALIGELWSGKFVTEGTLYNCVGELRNALGDDRVYIETIPRKGYRLVADVGRAGGEQDDTLAPSRSRVLPAVLVAAVIAAGLYFMSTRGPGPLPESMDDGYAIAVLPFDDLSTDGEFDYVGDGIAEALIHQLAQLPDVDVIARTSSFAFRDTASGVREIGRVLDVDSVLEGSVQKEGDTLRVIAQLIDAETGTHVWSQKYDRDAAGLFDVQDEIALSVAQRIGGTQVTSENLAYAGMPTPDANAYELYMQGQYHIYSLFAPDRASTNMNAPRDALEDFQRATEIDPQFALAWAGSARALFMMAMMEQVAFDEAGPRVREYIGKALEFGPDLAEVQFAAGQVDMSEGQLAFYDRAIEINPNYSEAHAARSSALLRAGRYKEAFAAIAEAARLDSRNPIAVEGALFAEFHRGRWDNLDSRIVSSNSLWPAANGLTTESYMMFELGRLDRFADLQTRADAIPGYGVDDWYASVPRHFGDTYLTLGMPAKAARWLTAPGMVASYDDVIALYEGDTDGALAFLLPELEKSAGRPTYAYRWQPDIVASIAEAYLYDRRYDELAEFFESLGWGPQLFPLPDGTLTNPPWPAVAYAHALMETNRRELATDWVETMAAELEGRLEQGIRLPNHFYELARLRILQGRLDDAFGAIETAVELGWRRWYFDRDPILEPLRALPQFNGLQARYDEDIARMRRQFDAETPNQ